eukprot:TRINITY_DN14912_c1_g1_i1.p1 TRINITY_DN14912_c1_g1~~TRINITY_DN14912_c1_g1_i1.p1  ORF type:complete len:647 (+),score=177.90 TRINITY_DN14912_c1_g1_i1:73-2013(+)
MTGPRGGRGRLAKRSARSLDGADLSSPGGIAGIDWRSPDSLACIEQWRKSKSGMRLAPAPPRSPQEQFSAAESKCDPRHLGGLAGGDDAAKAESTQLVLLPPPQPALGRPGRGGHRRGRLPHCLSGEVPCTEEEELQRIQLCTAAEAGFCEFLARAQLLQAAARQVAEKEALLRDSAATAEAAQGRVRELEQRLQEHRLARAAATRECAAVQESESVRMGMMVREKQQLLRTAQQQLDTVIAAGERLKARCSELAAERDALQADKVQLTAELAGLRERCTQLEARAAAARAEGRAELATELARAAQQQEVQAEESRPSQVRELPAHEAAREPEPAKLRSEAAAAELRVEPPRHSPAPDPVPRVHQSLPHGISVRTLGDGQAGDQWLVENIDILIESELGDAFDTEGSIADVFTANTQLFALCTDTGLMAFAIVDKVAGEDELSELAGDCAEWGGLRHLPAPERVRRGWKLSYLGARRGLGYGELMLHVVWDYLPPDALLLLQPVPVDLADGFGPMPNERLTAFYAENGFRVMVPGHPVAEFREPELSDLEFTLGLHSAASGEGRCCCGRPRREGQGRCAGDTAKAAEAVLAWMREESGEFIKLGPPVCPRLMVGPAPEPAELELRVRRAARRIAARGAAALSSADS